MSEASKTDFTQLRKKAARATPGPWGFARADLNSGVEPEIVVLRNGSATGDGIARGIGPLRTRGTLIDPDAQVYKNAHFISAADPTVVLQLLDEIERLRGAVVQLREWAKSHDPPGRLAVVGWAVETLNPTEQSA